MSTHDTIAILDYGSQTAQLIARRIRELHVYCELIPWNAPAERFAELNPRGYILSGGPASVYEAARRPCRRSCSLPANRCSASATACSFWRMRWAARLTRRTRREYGLAQIELTDIANPFFANLKLPASSFQLQVWMSHGDHVTDLPPTFAPLALTPSSVAAMGDVVRGIYGVQFHPEVQHTPQGKELLHNFVLDICGCRPDWTPANFIMESVAALQAQVGEGRVICGLSGGVDSAVVAALLHRAIGDRLTCIFVDHGLLRQGEATQVVETFQRHMGMRLIAVDAAGEFTADLAGTVDPEEKRKRIGARFIRTFEAAEAEAARAVEGGHAAYLAQGTLYPDVIESASRHEQATARTIKTHHNVGGLPEDMNFQLIEPLRSLFKDEVRLVGEALGLPEEIVWRHPFPGPGLAIRIIGEVTAERLETLRCADAIFLEELRAAGLYRAVSQAFAVLLPVRSVGVMGDGRTYAEHDRAARGHHR